MTHSGALGGGPASPTVCLFLILLSLNPLIYRASAGFYGKSLGTSPTSRRFDGAPGPLHPPEDAEDHDSRKQRHEGDAVADGVADLHLPEELALSEQQRQDHMLTSRQQPPHQKSFIRGLNWITMLPFRISV